MAVKKHELVHVNRNQLDLKELAQYIQMINEQHNYLPPPQELIKNCQDIVGGLVHTTGNEEELWELLQLVEEFLVRVISTIHSDTRNELVTAVLNKVYSFISDSQIEASPATSIVLLVLDGQDSETNLAAARCVVQQADDGSAAAGLKTSLSCLYRWMYDWHGTTVLGTWVMAYIKALEEKERFEILIEVSTASLSRLFLSMEDPLALRESEADVIFHVLASLRESSGALDRISSHVGRVLANLANDSGQWSRQILQNVVDILTATIDRQIEMLKDDAQDIFKEKYADVISCLERHMATRDCPYLVRAPWRLPAPAPNTSNAHMPMRKAGLLNLGNTCYMNSVLQALLVTKQFSSHAVLRMTQIPCWSMMSVLFAKMMFSITTKLDPEEFFRVVKPPFFTRDNQHDSSEFLVHLFELLQSYEYAANGINPRQIQALGHTWEVFPANAQNGHSSNAMEGVEYAEASDRANGNRRSASPRPGSSGGSSRNTNSLKRGTSDVDNIPPKKRLRLDDFLVFRRFSFINNLFGGVLLTRVECSGCHCTSYSRDVFRDLHLAFPEKPKGQFSVQSLLEFYCTKERLTGCNKYKCGHCGVLREADRSVLIEATPKYLVLVLKYFKYEPKLQVHSKLMHPMYHNHTVTLPTVRTQTEISTYNLYAAVIHAGTTLDSGHYYTIAKDNDQWHKYNDDVVSIAEEGEINKLKRSSTPYMLFYRRTDIDDGKWPLLSELPQRLQETVKAHNKHCIETARKMRLARP